jgi:hypothetical protein
MHFASELRLQQVRVRLGDHRREAEIFGMIRHNEEIQRSLQARPNARARSDLLAAGEPIGLFRSQPATQHPRVSRIRRVQVCVAEIHAVGIALVQVGRVFAFAKRHLVGINGDILGNGRQREDGGDQTREGQHLDGFGLHWFSSVRLR